MMQKLRAPPASGEAAARRAKDSSSESSPSELSWDARSTAAADGSTPPATERTPTSLHDLPPEIHLMISKHLIYPDALSLKHSCSYFHRLVDTGIKLKVDWLMERRSLHLECPNDKRCDLGSDLKFCRGSVRLLMQRRREHMECESRPGLGCLVYGTPTCTNRRGFSERWKRWFRKQLTVEVWWIILALVPVLLSWVWLADVVMSWRS